jgi:hypothetical protein
MVRPWRIEVGPHEVCLVPAGGARPAVDATPIARELAAGQSAGWLAALVRREAPRRIAELAQVLEGSFARVGSAEALRGSLRRGLANGRIRAFRLPRRPLDDGVTAPEVAAPRPEVATRDFIEVVVVDEFGVPMPNIRYAATLSDGSRVRGRTDQNGLIRYAPIESGTCDFELLGVG